MERLVQIKRLIFIRSVLILDDQILSKKIFVERAMFLFNNQDGYDFDDTWSVVAHLLNTAIDFNLIDKVCNMVIRGHSCLRSVWKQKVRDRAWSLEDTYWRIQILVHKNLDLLDKVISGSLYLNWWRISDRYPERIMQWETAAKIVCHASLLKVNDARFKCLSIINRQISSV